MMSKFSMRELHRYLGFFLAGVMLIYSVSGIIMIFRNDDTFKVDKQIENILESNLSVEDVGKVIKDNNLKITKTEGDIQFFVNDTYNSRTGRVNYSLKEFPYLIDKMTHLHKATTEDPLYYVNIFFGLSLFFFVLSSFWMFRPKTQIFRQGIIPAVIGFILTLLLVLI